MRTFVANFLGYAATKIYRNWIILSQVFAEVKMVTFFETQCSYNSYNMQLTVTTPDGRLAYKYR